MFVELKTNYIRGVEMKISEIKATLYDIFGYILPGLLLIFLSYIMFKNFNKVFDFIEIINGFILYVDIKKIVLLLIIAYFLGHALSSFSSFTVEKIFLKISKGMQDEKIISSEMFGLFKKIFYDIFAIEYKKSDFRTVICYVESREPAIYSTAFAFLSFYGMARCVAFIFSIFFVFEIIVFIKYFQYTSMYCAIGFLFLSVTFYYEYYRFFRYFKQEIMMGFVLPKN